jgi:hypothetical protein
VLIPPKRNARLNSAPSIAMKERNGNVRSIRPSRHTRDRDRSTRRRWWPRCVVG